MGDISAYLSLAEAAKELGVSKSRVEQFVREKRLPVTWFAGRRVALKTDVAALAAAKRKKAGRPPKEEGVPTPAKKPKKGRK